MNKKNLLKLADGIEGIDPELFNMKTYRSGDFDCNGDFRKAHCGTVGCALGWGPYIEGLEIDRDISWDDYCERVLGLDGISDEWFWCFGAGWEKVDNTPWGASLRIRYLAKHGLPNNSQEQEKGNARYIFKEDI